MTRILEWRTLQRPQIQFPVPTPIWTCGSRKSDVLFLLLQAPGTYRMHMTVYIHAKYSHTQNKINITNERTGVKRWPLKCVCDSVSPHWCLHLLLSLCSKSLIEQNAKKPKGTNHFLCWSKKVYLTEIRLCRCPVVLVGAWVLTIANITVTIRRQKARLWHICSSLMTDSKSWVTGVLMKPLFWEPLQPDMKGYNPLCG